MKITNQCSTITYPFEHFCKLILSVVPKEDMVGISEIRFVDNFSDTKINQDAFGSYDRGTTGRDAVIEVNIPNHLKEEIDEYTFSHAPEVAALLLSTTVFHEIGHHVHLFKRHGIKKQKYEEFADNYTRAGYYHYLILRKTEILSDFTRESSDLSELDKEGRDLCRKSRSDLIEWMDKHTEGIPFP